ncbi:MOSC domain-containing protein [Inquilinus sp. CAU 1745]|uniref:MOSC domain-containing protein n=1 Tax=Inquilinus sp. CAU 1745 TaxID=3140369 RepID=UPI00325C28D3
MTVAIRAILVGTVSPLGPRGVASGIDKHAVSGPVAVRIDGLAGDEQGDRKHHGGPEKAIHHYPFDHYAAWRRNHPDIAWRLGAEGAFGENLSTLGMTEDDVCIGDVYRLGTALMEVSQGRQPCWRLNERFANRGMARHVQESGRTGWYYRVLEEGAVSAGDVIVLQDRPAGTMSLGRIAEILYRKTLDVDALSALAELPRLSESWRTLARRRLASMNVEDWSHRLTTPLEA